MNIALAEKKTKKVLTEEDILASLDSAISAYNKKDFELIAPAPIKRSSKKTQSKEANEANLVNVTKTQKAKKIFTAKRKIKSTSTTKRKQTKAKGVSYIGNTVKKIKDVSFLYRRQLLTSSLAIIMMTFVGFTSYIAYAYIASNTDNVVEKVAQHLVLNVDEAPKVYIIQSEKSEIFQNPLFKGIQVGDNVLTYSKANRVVIYRSSEDKIVNIVTTQQ